MSGNFQKNIDVIIIVKNKLFDLNKHFYHQYFSKNYI